MSDVAQNCRTAAAGLRRSPITKAALIEAADEIDKLREALRPFSAVADWAQSNGCDLEANFDVLLRGPGHEKAGHLHALSKAFVRAGDMLNEPS
jgi:hypothetical protein